MDLKQTIQRNFLLRSKYPDTPSKFMESELKLHETISNLPSSLKDLPPSYPELLVGLLTHENEDVSATVLRYLLTSPELPSELNADILIQTLLREHEELRISALSILDRLASSKTTTSKSSAIILINLCCSKSTSKKVKFTCSDYLFTYLTSSPSVLVLDLDPILKSLSSYRKRDPEGEDEKEHVANMFSCLCTLLNSQENRNSFRRLEGMELMIRLIKARNFTSSLALRTYFFFYFFFYTKLDVPVFEFSIRYIQV